LDYASPATREAGEKLIQIILDEKFKTKRKKLVCDGLQKIEDGTRDVYI
jgi:2-iminoacetate synthase